MGNIRGYAFIMAVIALALMTLPAHASSIDIKKKIEAEKTRHAETLRQSKAIGVELAALKAKLVAASSVMAKTQESISVSENKLRLLAEKRLASVARIRESEKTFGSFLSAARRQGATTTGETLLTSDPLFSARTSIVIKSIIPKLHKERQAYLGELQQYAALQEKIAREIDQNQKEIKSFSDQNKNLKALLEERNALYKKTEITRLEQEKNLARLAKEAKSIEDLVKKIERQKPQVADTAKTEVAAVKSSYKLPRSMILPVQGKIRTGFSETDALGAKSRGVTFSAKNSIPVVTPLAGKVKFAGPFQKYRQILIIEHKGGYHSLIAGLGRIDTVVGAALDAGEPVGMTETGNDQAEIYYELRLNGDPVNPQKINLAETSRGKS